MVKLISSFLSKNSLQKTTEAGYSTLINERRNEVMDVFRSELSGLKIGGSGGGVNINLYNSVVEKNVADYIVDTVSANQIREDSRSYTNE